MARQPRIDLPGIPQHIVQRDNNCLPCFLDDAYRALLAEAINDEDLAAIRLYLQQQRAYGRDDFRAMVEAKTQRFAGARPAHRPPKPSVTSAYVNLTPFYPALARPTEPTATTRQVG